MIGVVLAATFFGMVHLLLAIVLVVPISPLRLNPPFPPGPWFAAFTAGPVLSMAGGFVAVGQAFPLRIVLARGAALSWIRPTVLGSFVGGLVVGYFAFLADASSL